METVHEVLSATSVGQLLTGLWVLAVGLAFLAIAGGVSSLVKAFFDKHNPISLPLWGYRGLGLFAAVGESQPVVYEQVS